MTRGYPDYGHGYITDDFTRIVPPGRFLGEYLLLAARTETVSGKAKSLIVPPAVGITILVDVTALSGTNPLAVITVQHQTSVGDYISIASSGAINEVAEYQFWTPYYTQVYTIDWFLAGPSVSIDFSLRVFLQ